MGGRRRERKIAEDEEGKEKAQTKIKEWKK